MRAGARVREARAVFDLRKWFLEMRILLGFTPVVTFGIFWLLAKPVKFYMRAYMFWWNWIREFEIIKFWINSRGYTMRRNWRNEKFSENKILTCRDWVIILRTIYTTWTLDHRDYSGLLINLPYQTNKTHSDYYFTYLDKVLFLCGESPVELDLARLSLSVFVMFLTYSPNHCSAPRFKTFRPSMMMIYCEALKWCTTTTRMRCAIPQCLSTMS